MGFQDFSQLTRDYGEKESKVIQNTVGNIFSGQVVGETAKTLSERFGKVLQQRQSVSINRQDVSTSINTQLDSLIPASKIANLSQGTFVGAVADNFGEKIEQKIFHAEIVVDHAAVSAEEKAYRKIPFINEFKDKDGNDIMMQQIQRNYDQIKSDAQAIINEEMDRIKTIRSYASDWGWIMKNIQEGVILPLIKYQDEVCVGDFPINFPHILSGRSSAIGVFLSSTSRTPRQSPSFPHVLFAHSAPVQESHG